MHFKNLVLSGAQIKGLSYIGVGKAMNELNLMNFENILGVSSGAIFAFTLAVNLDINDIENLVLGINKEHLMDINLDNILQFTESYGFDSGKKFEKIFKILCNKILGDENATFEDLKRKKNSKNLIICGSNISLKKQEFFCYKTTPNMPIWIALRISISIPIYFNKVCYNGYCYCDEGITNNLPIFYFDNFEETLGIIITDPSTYKNNNNLSFQNYLYRIIDCMVGQYQRQIKEKYKENIIEIFIIYDIFKLKFDNAVKNEIILNGYKQFKQKYYKIKDKKIEKIILELLDDLKNRLILLNNE